MNPIRNLRAVVRHALAWRRARRDYQVLCNEGRAATLRFSVGIHPEDYEWTGLNGMTGLTATVPLSRRGKRYMAGVIDDIERTCVRAVLEATEASRAPAVQDTTPGEVLADDPGVGNTSEEDPDGS